MVGICNALTDGNMNLLKGISLDTSLFFNVKPDISFAFLVVLFNSLHIVFCAQRYPK